MHNAQISKNSNGLICNYLSIHERKQDLCTVCSIHCVYKNSEKSHQNGPEIYKTGWKR